MWQPYFFSVIIAVYNTVYQEKRMSIRYIEKNRQLILETKNTGYHMQIDKLGYLQHMYYGPKPGQDEMS